MDEIISICIPTFNRYSYLKDLLESIASEIVSKPQLMDKIKIYIIDNASTDSTQEVCQKYSRLFDNLTYLRNEKNIGGDNNIFKCCKTGSGKYRWVVGDDELIAPGGLSHIIRILEMEQPGLFINSDGKFKTKLRLPNKYQNYREFADATIRTNNSHFLIAHTLITANIFLSESFDAIFAERMLPNTTYAHMYGMVNGLIKTNKPVYVTKVKTIIIRTTRAELVEKENQTVLESFPKYWKEYLSWLSTSLKLQNLDVDAILKSLENKEARVLQSIWSKIVYVARIILPHGFYIAIKRYKDKPRYRRLVKLG